MMYATVGCSSVRSKYIQRRSDCATRRLLHFYVANAFRPANPQFNKEYRLAFVLHMCTQSLLVYYSL